MANSVYPGSIDTSLTIPFIVDNSTEIKGDAINPIINSLFAVEQTLGVVPQSTFGTVRNRLDYLTGLFPAISAQFQTINSTLTTIQAEIAALQAGGNIPTAYNGTPASIGTSLAGISNQYARGDHVHDHGNLAGGTFHAIVTHTVNGFMSAADKVILDNLAASSNPGQTAATPNTLALRGASAEIFFGNITGSLITATGITATSSLDINSAATLSLSSASGNIQLITALGTQLNNGVSFFSAISPTGISGTVNNYNPTGLSTGLTRIRQDLTGPATLTGLIPWASIKDGSEVTIFNISASNTLTINHDDSGSSAANRFYLKSGTAGTITPLGSIRLSYDTVSSRWREVGHDVNTGGGGSVTSVGGTAPISSTGGTTPAISIAAASGITAGSMSAADFTKLAGITAGAAVASVSGTSPIASSGGTTPAISIAAASGITAGSMSASDFTKLAGITAGAAVAAVTGTAPIVSSGGTSPAISINAATTGSAGSLSASDKTKLDSITSGAAIANVTGSNGIVASGTTTINLAPSNTITNFTSGTQTIVVDRLGAENTVAYTTSALTLPLGSVGDKARVRLLNFTSDIVITATGSDLIKGNATYTIRGTANPYAWVDLECVATNVWTAIGGGPSLPAYVANSGTSISLSHNGTSGGSGHTDQWLAEDAASGAFNGGSLYFQVGNLGNSSSLSGNFTVHLNSAAASTQSGSFILTAGSSPTNRLKMYGYNDSGGVGGLHGEFRGGSFDWGSNSGSVDFTGSNTFSISFPTVSTAALNTYWNEGSTFLGLEARGHVSLTTTGAVVIGNAIYGMTTGEFIGAHAIVTIVCPATGHGAILHRYGAFDCVAGTPVQTSTTNNGGIPDIIHSSLAGVDAGFSIASNNVKCTATGIAATNLNVTCRMLATRAA